MAPMPGCTGIQKAHASTATARESIERQFGRRIRTIGIMEALFQPIYNLIDTLFPFCWANSLFMKRALLEIVLITPLCALIGIQVVNYRMAFFSDAISHSAFTGIALGLLLAVNPFFTTVAFGILVALGIAKFKTRSDLPMDTIIGVFFAATIALGIAVISARKELYQTLPAFLFGDVLTITEEEILMTLVLFVSIIIFLAFAYNRLLLTGLNEHLARSQDVPTVVYNYSFAAILATVVGLGIRTVGILLITALLIIPAASARNISRNAGNMFWYSLFFALISGITGLLFSFYTDVATGAAVILTASVCFMATFCWGLVKG
ncbi:MAG: metal ABC transporter permease [Pseudomonadota bacterium]